MAQNVLYVVSLGYAGGREAAARDWLTLHLLGEWGAHIMVEAEYGKIQKECVKKYEPKCSEEQEGSETK